MHKNSYLKMKWFKNTYLDTSKKLNILDIGSLDKTGNFNYSTLFNEKEWNYTGIDIEAGHNVDIVVKDIYNWTEIKNNSYDVIISGQFFEHLEFFWRTLAQIKRVLRPEGYLCIIVPSAGPRHGGDLPNCYIYNEDGLKAIAKEIGLEVLHTSIDTRKEAKPWHDACLVAHKAKVIPKPKKPKKDNRDKLVIQMDNLNQEMDSFLRDLKK